MDSWVAMITKEELGIRDEPVKVLRASLAGSANFSTVWRMNSDFYLYVTFNFIYSLFQIHFPTEFLSHSLSHLNIIFSFIIYYFFNNYTSSNIFLFNI